MRGALAAMVSATAQYQSLYPNPDETVGQSSFMNFAIPPQGYCRRTPAI